MGVVEKAIPVGGKINPSIIVQHYVYAWQNTTTKDTVVNSDGYTKATVKALSNVTANIVANLNGTKIPNISAGEEIEIEITGDAVLSATYTGTITMHLQITLHD